MQTINEQIFSLSGNLIKKRRKRRTEKKTHLKVNAARQMAKQKRQASSFHLWSAKRTSSILMVAVMMMSLAAGQNTDAGEDAAGPTTPINSAAPTTAQQTTSFSPSPSPTFSSTSPSTSLNGCPDDSITFELITGYVYSAPADMLDSQPGTLMLTDCIQTCRQNATCQAINYETGLCVLFSSNADSMPGNKN